MIVACAAYQKHQFPNSIQLVTILNCKIKRIKHTSALLATKQSPQDEQQLQNWRVQAERNFNKQLAKNRLDYDRKMTDERRSMRVQPLESNMNKEEIQQWRTLQKQEISEQQEQQQITKSEAMEQIVFITAAEKRDEEAWQLRMKIGAATATAAIEILESASETSRATSLAAMDILASATRAARATAAAAADILGAVTETTSAASTASRDVLQVEVQRRRDGLPFQAPSIPSPPTPTPSIPFFPTPTPSISPTSSPLSSSYFNADGSTRLNRTSAPVSSNPRDKTIVSLELKIEALKKAQIEQQLKLKKIKDEEDKLAAASLRSILDAEL